MGTAQKAAAKLAKAKAKAKVAKRTLENVAPGAAFRVKARATPQPRLSVAAAGPVSHSEGRRGVLPLARPPVCCLAGRGHEGGSKEGSKASHHVVCHGGYCTAGCAGARNPRMPNSARRRHALTCCQQVLVEETSAFFHFITFYGLSLVALYAVCVLLLVILKALDAKHLLNMLKTMLHEVPVFGKPVWNVRALRPYVHAPLRFCSGPQLAERLFGPGHKRNGEMAVAPLAECFSEGALPGMPSVTPTLPCRGVAPARGRRLHVAKQQDGRPQGVLAARSPTPRTGAGQGGPQELLGRRGQDRGLRRRGMGQHVRTV